MANVSTPLNVFNKLPDETVLKLAEFFDENILLTSSKKSELERIIDEDLKNDDIEDIISSFYNFVASKGKSEKIFNVIDNAELEQDKKMLLKTTIQKIHDRVDLEKMATGTSLKTALNNENKENENAFNDFLKDHVNDPKYRNKFVVFVDGKLQDIGNVRSVLAKKMYDQFGNVNMYVGKITDRIETVRISTPEFN